MAVFRFSAGVGYLKMERAMNLETLDVHGTPRELGLSQGEAFRSRIEAFVQIRLAAVRSYMTERGQPEGWELLFEVGAKSLSLFANWDPDGYAEHQGIADGANIDFLQLFICANMTDMRDAVLLCAQSGRPLERLPDEGCTSVLIPSSHTQNGNPLVGQTWDLNPPDVEHIVAVRRRPHEGPQTWSVTCNGCLSLMGMNEYGLAVGTTNIKTYGSRPGVGYLSILHRALRAHSVDEAKGVVQNAPHAGAHTYWLADGAQQIEWEASPNETHLRTTEEGPLWRTNHCLSEEHRLKEGEVVSESSKKRFLRVEDWFKECADFDKDALIRIFSSRSDGVHSVNRYPEDEQGTATNAVFIADPITKTAWACRGPADRGTWVTLSF